MKNRVAVSATVVLSFFFAPLAVGDIVTPSGALATSQFGLGVITVDGLINGSGLDGAGAVEDQLHGNVNSDMWLSGCEDAGIDGGTPADCPTGFEAAPVDEQIVEFVLDGTYDLSSAIVWNYNENSDFGPLVARGVKTFELQVSASQTGPFTSVGTFELASANTDGNPEAAQSLDIDGMAGTDGVRRVRFVISDNHSEGEDGYVGLSEVRFDGIEIVGPKVPALNELGLATLALAILCLGGLLVFQPRRSRRASPSI